MTKNSKPQKSNSNLRLKPYKIVVKLESSPNVNIYQKFTSKSEARSYAQEKWPDSKIVSIEQSKPPRLTPESNTLN